MQPVLHLIVINSNLNYFEVHIKYFKITTLIFKYALLSIMQDYLQPFLVFF